ncbi:MAG: HAMP domain-containing sensor histidine kinase, partial [Spirochaetaceae bacterium]|nr:HAMP domain-containing sensor histidine kinase [Spirochaetaceae bacterium]
EFSVATKKRNESNKLLQKSIEMKKIMHSKLIESEKMTTIGKMVAGVTHEIRNPLGICVTLTSHLDSVMSQFYSDFLEQLLKRSSMEDYLSRIEESTEGILYNLNRVANQVRNFKQVAVDQHGIECRVINIKDYFQGIIESIKFLTKISSIQLKLDIPDNIVGETYPGALSQIITNLILNSIKHAFPQRKEGIISISGYYKKGRMFLEISDDGIGMNKAIAEKAFEPFFTTKKDIDGTGLGLSIVENMIKQKLKGKINLESTPQRGSHFYIDFPIKGAELQE